MNPSERTQGKVRKVKMPDEPSRGTGLISFSGHETFTLRHGWLKKALDAVASDPHVFSNERAMVDLGVGKNMVRSIRHWALATEILTEVPGTRGADLSITEFGKLIFGHDGLDPYLEDVNSLWLLQWKLTKHERRSTGWHWMFNLLRGDEFTRDLLLELFGSELRRRNIVGPSESSLKRDIDCAIRTYVGTRSKAELLEESLECPLVELELVAEDIDGLLFKFNRGPKSSLSDEVFLYALLEFWETQRSRESLAFSEIAFGAGSPGCSFKLDENSIASRLERLAAITHGALIYDETSGLKQVYRRSSLTPETVLANYYDKFFAITGA
jgi:hypothetical protein